MFPIQQHFSHPAEPRTVAFIGRVYGPQGCRTSLQNVGVDYSTQPWTAHLYGPDCPGLTEADVTVRLWAADEEGGVVLVSDVSNDYVRVVPVPEPTGMEMLLAGIVGLLLLRLALSRARSARPAGNP